MGFYQLFQDKLHVLNCANCGMTFGITADFEERRRNDHKGFMCPNGHSNVYNGKSEAEKLQQQLDEERRRRERAEQRIHSTEDDLQHEKDRVRAYKGQVTKIKKRVGKGVCPCCNRHFVNLERHMAGQHPEYHHAKEEVAA